MGKHNSCASQTHDQLNLLLFTANSTHSWPNVVGLFSWLVDVIRSVRYEKLMKMMFGYEDDEEMPENFLGSKVLVFVRLKFWQQCC